MPRVSVIIPTYNRKDYVQEAIDSVLAQTYTDYEIIVVDDGSTDGTSSELERYGSSIKVIAQPNSGVATARNEGVRDCSGEYVAFLDADDRFIPAHLATLTSIFDCCREDSIGWAGGNWQYIDSEGMPVSYISPGSSQPDFTIRGLLFSWPIQPSGVLVKRSWVERVGGFDESLLRAEECDLWLRLAHGGCIMKWTSDVVCQIRLHGGQKSRHVLLHKASVLAFLERFFSRPDVNSELRSLRNEVIAHHLFNYACRECYAGLLEEARHDIVKAVLLDPRLVADQIDQTVEMTVGQAMSYRNDREPIEAIRLFFDNLPVEAAALRKRRRQALAQVTAAKYFRAHDQGDFRSVRHLFPSLVLKNPAWLSNIGVYSIAIRSWLKSE